MLSLFLPTKTDSPVLKSVAPNDGVLLRDCVIITWRGGGGGGGGGKVGGGGEKMTTRERGGGVGSKIQYIRAGGITFSFLFANWKSSGTDIRVQIFILNTTVFLSVMQ